MADFLLIHGSCHGSWCWRDLVPALETRGHRARTVDLPGHGDGRDPDSVTLEETAEAILRAARPDDLILGHSWGGFPISAAAERDPKAMRGLIYLCAYVPVSGLSLIEMRQRGPRQTLTGATEKNAAGTSYSVLPDRAPALFYHDCPQDSIDYALARLCPQPIRPQATPLTLGANWQSVPKHYIRCSDDRTIPPEYQAQMVADWPAETVRSMATSHSPFFSAPDPLAEILTDIAKD